MGGSGSKEAATNKLDGDTVAQLLGQETKSEVSIIPETVFREREHIEELDLNGFGSIKALPEMGKLVHLQTLKLHQCSALAEIPSSIGQCTAMRTLSLYGCSALTSLPDEIGRLPELQELNLRCCSGLASLPPALGQGLPSLRLLNLTLCTGVASLPDSIGELQALQTLYLGGCVHLTVLPSTLVNLTALVTLNLYNCSGLTTLPERLDLLQSLQVLSCQGCGALVELPDELVMCPSLRTLTLWGCDALQRLPNLSQAQRLAEWTIDGCPEHLAASDWPTAQMQKLREQRASPLHEACEAGDLKAVRYLVEGKGVEVELKNEAGQSPLHDACYHGHLEVVRYLVGEKGADVHATGYGGWYGLLYDGATPLRYACERDHPEVVLYLVEEKGAQLDMTDEYERTPLLWACAHGRLEVVKYLVGKHEKRLDATDAKDAWQSTLDCACERGLHHLDVVRYLVGEKDARIDIHEAQRKNWLVCWRNMTFSDMHGYPLWETQLHDVLQAAFPELQPIFLHYCGSSVKGSASTGHAARVGLTAMLKIAKDTGLCTEDFKVDELTRQAKKGGTMDGQGGLNLFEFISFLVRVAFSRANPQWGSKYNKKDLTPVPEAMQILLDECVLPKAKRDTSGGLQKMLSVYAAHGLSPFHSRSFLSKVLADEDGGGLAAQT